MRIKLLVLIRDALLDAAELNPVGFMAMVDEALEAAAAGRPVGIDLGRGMPLKILAPDEVEDWLRQTHV